ASRFQPEITGLVLVDAAPATWPTTLCAVPDDGTPATAGFGQLCTAVTTPAGNAEHLDGLTAFDDAARIDTVGDLPMVVMTAAQHPWGLGEAENAHLDDAWNAGQDHCLALSP